MTPLQEALANAVRELQRTHDAYIKARDAVQTLLGQTPQQGRAIRCTTRRIMPPATAQDGPGSTIAPPARVR